MSNWIETKELKEKLGGLIKTAQDMVKLSMDNGTELDKGAFDKVKADIERNRNLIKESEELSRIDAANRNITEDFTKSFGKEDKESVYNRAFYKKLLGMPLDNAETYAAQSSSASAALPTTLANAFIETLKYDAGAVECGAEVFQTPSGEPYKRMLLDDTASLGAIIAEGSSGSGAAIDDTAGVTWTSYAMNSGYVDVPLSYERDIVGLQNWLEPTLIKRLIRKMSYFSVMGTNSSQPQGFNYAPTVGVTSASTTAFTLANMDSLLMSVNSIYRQRNKAVIVLNSSIFAALIGLVDDQGQSVLKYGDAASEYITTFRGYKIVEVPHMPDAAAAKNIIGFGDLSEACGVRLIGQPKLFADPVGAINRTYRVNMWMDFDVKTKVASAYKTLKTAAS